MNGPGKVPLARTLIHDFYDEKGVTTQIVVAPLPDCGLPDSLVEAGQPIRLDLLSGRPVNLVLDDTGLSADLCFQGPPVSCRFPWASVLAVRDPSGSLVKTMVVTMAMVMDDGSLETVAEVAGDENPTQPEREGEAPRLRIVRDQDE